MLPHTHVVQHASTNFSPHQEATHDHCRPKLLCVLMRRIHAGELHVLVNNVGTAIGRATLEYSPADVQMVFATNLGAAFHLSQACHPLLKASGDASILFMSSTAGGPLAMRPAPVYAMTKGAPALALRP